MEYSVLKFHISNTYKFGYDLLYEHIVKSAKDFGIVGATVYRGIMGFGKSSTHISTSKLWELTEKLPVVVELIEQTEILLQFYKIIESQIYETPKGCMITIQPVEILLHKASAK